MNDELNVIAGIAGKVFNCFTEMTLKGPKRGKEKELQSRLHSAPPGLGQFSSHRNIMHSSLTLKKKKKSEKELKTTTKKTSKAYVLGDKSYKTSSQQ